jgi:hypothetical protein
MTMKKIFLVPLIGLLIVSCEVNKKKEGELPELDVDVTADAGELPEYEINWADVDVGTTTKTVEVPKLVVVMEEEEVEIPYLDIDMPNDKYGDKSERTIAVEAEVSDVEHDIEIKEIWASEGNLYVISALKKGEKQLGDQKMRVSDHVTINAPDLNVRHYIIGERPDRVFNSQYDYVADVNDLKKKIDDFTVIYSR